MHDLDPEPTPAEALRDALRRHGPMPDGVDEVGELHGHDQRVDNTLSLVALAIGAAAIVAFALWGIIR